MGSTFGMGATRRIYRRRVARTTGEPSRSPHKGPADARRRRFDGDGMLHGVYFARTPGSDELAPMFVNKFVLTDVYLASVRRGAPTLPSIATLISPSTSFPSLLATLIRATLVQLMSSISRLTVANTAIVFHDRRLLATCESGPCVEVTAPSLDTIGYWVFEDGKGHGLGKVPLTVGRGEVGGKMMGGMLEEWTTGHPKVDPITGELVFIGYNVRRLALVLSPDAHVLTQIFARPFLTHSVVARDGTHVSLKRPVSLPRPKMMHDFGASLGHSIILDLPLTMDPLNLVRPASSSGKTRMQPMVHFDRTLRSRFGVLPRTFDGDQSRIRWFETEPCMIFHTANSWDETARDGDEVVAVNMLACRFLSAKLVHSAGGLPAPAMEERVARETNDVVRLTYYRFSLSSSDPHLPSSHPPNAPTYEVPLSSIPFEFSTVPHARTMQRSRYVYGLSLASGSFDSALEGARPDVLVKMDVDELISRAQARGQGPSDEAIDSRRVADILAQQHARRRRPDFDGIDEQERDPIKLFRLPPLHFASEPSFVPRADARSEDDGYLVFYVFDESQLLPDGSLPSCEDEVRSELWVVDAARIGFGDEVVTRVRLPRRVPYGLHSEWVTEEQILSQRKDVKTRSRGGQGVQAQVEVVQGLDEAVELMDDADRAARSGPAMAGQSALAAWVWMAVIGMWATLTARWTVPGDKGRRRVVAT